MGGWTFQDLSTLPGLTLARGTPTSYLFPAQHTRHVVHLGYSPTGGGTNQALDEWFSGSDNVWDAIGLMIGSDAPPARSNPYGYVYTSEGTQHIVYESSADFGRIHELYWDNDGWHSNDLTNTPGAVLASSVPRGYGFEPGFQSNQHVIYTGIDGHVHELARSHGSWNHFDLTLDTTGAPPAVAEPFGYPFDTQGTQHVIYRGGTGSINEMWWDTSGWHYEPLSEQTGAPAAGSEPVGYVFAAQGTQHIDYIGTNAHVYELWWDPTGWHVEDLSLHTGTTNVVPVGAVAAYPFEAAPGAPEPTQHVLYRGTDSHIHELWWDSSGWHHHDLNDVPGLPLAAGDPTGFADGIDSTQHIFFVSDDHHLIALKWAA